MLPMVHLHLVTTLGKNKTELWKMNKRATKMKRGFKYFLYKKRLECSGPLLGETVIDKRNS